MTYTNKYGNSYDIACYDGLTFDDCMRVGANDTCNEPFKYACADWVQRNSHVPFAKPKCVDPHNCNKNDYDYNNIDYNIACYG